MSALASGFDCSTWEPSIDPQYTSRPSKDHWGYHSEKPDRYGRMLAILDLSLRAYSPYEVVEEEVCLRTVNNVVVPELLWPIADAIDQSRWMLDLKEDWDGEGSLGYTEKTWQCAVNFLVQNALSLLDRFQVIANVPDIHNGPEGSIDIYWNTPQGKLLINVPPESAGKASFYGRSTTGDEIKGVLSLNTDNLWLLLWQADSRLHQARK